MSFLFSVPKKCNDHAKLALTPCKGRHSEPDIRHLYVGSREKEGAEEKAENELPFHSPSAHLLLLLPSIYALLFFPLQSTGVRTRDLRGGGRAAPAAGGDSFPFCSPFPSAPFWPPTVEERKKERARARGIKRTEIGLERSGWPPLSSFGRSELGHREILLLPPPLLGTGTSQRWIGKDERGGGRKSGGDGGVKRP